jgi:subtilisin family serine protease
VAAVDENKERAYFSQANDRVDMAAPGVSILSTIPVSPNVVGVIEIRVGNVTFQATSMVYGPSLPSQGITAPISMCGNDAHDGCRESSGAVCVIERYVLQLR